MSHEFPAWMADHVTVRRRIRPSGPSWVGAVTIAVITTATLLLWWWADTRLDYLVEVFPQ